MQSTPTDLGHRSASAHRISRWAGAEALARWLAATVLVLVAACGGGSESGVSAPPTGAAASFSVEVTPASALAFPGSRRVLDVTLTRSVGFSADVAVDLSNPPPGVSAEALVFSGSMATLSMSVRLDDEVVPGTLALVLAGSGGGSAATASLQLAVQPPQPDAQQKIAGALAVNSIDRDTALLYRLYALHGDPRLPEAYVGSGSAQEDMRVFSEVEGGWSQMSAAMQAAMRPFLVRPDHPESIYRRPDIIARAATLSATAGQRESAAAASPPATCATGAQWRSERSTAIPVRVWTECNADDFITEWNSELGRKDLQVFEKIWPSMTALMGAPRLDGESIFDDAGKDITDNGGDDAIDVYLVGGYSLSRAAAPINTAALGSAVGFARPAGKCVTNGSGTLSCSGYMVLPSANAGKRGQRATIIHEFFHVLQFRHNTSLAFVADWFYEASATWAESHYDRELAWDAKVALTEVHRPRFTRFLSADDSVHASVGLRPYAAYIWPFFLEQETGSSVIIGQIWTALQAAKTAADENRIVDGAYSFDANFHRFALRNINEELMPGDPIPIAERYIALAGVVNGEKQFPDGTVKPKYITSTLSAGSEETRSFLMAPWSAAYEKFLVNGAALPSRVQFDFSGLSNRGSLKLDALILTHTGAGEEWVSRPVPLDPDAKAIFCFELGRSTTTVRGEFKELRLVLSNSSPDRFVTGQVVVRPTTKPCGVWEGTVDTTIDFEFAGATTRMTSSATLAFEFDEALSDNRTRAYTVRSGNFSFQSRTDIPNRNPACRSIATGSGTVRPQNTPMDLSDGAASGAVATFTSDAGTPKYLTGGVLVFTTLTVVGNCNDRNVDVTSLAPMSTVVLWVPQEGQTFDIKQNGTAMQESRSFQLGPETRASTWNLSKKTE